jgi:hypothetical protein
MASVSVVAAAPKKDAKKADKGPVAPAKDAAPAIGGGAAGSGSGSGSGGGSGDAVQMTEDAPPADMNGVDENPDAPRTVGSETRLEAAVPAPTRAAGYPIEEALRPITLPANMSEVTLDPHVRVGEKGAIGSSATTALHARYGITRQVQLGLTYVVGGMYDDPVTRGKDYGFHAGKAVGLDVTVLLENWIGVRVGVPVYVQPVAIAVALGAPIKFQLSDKVAVGGLDDVVELTIKRFAPSFYTEGDNALGAFNDTTTTQQSRGHIRIAAYGIYQYQPNTALIGRFGIDNDLGGAGGTMAGTEGTGGTATFLRAGVQWTPRRYCDLGGSIGFDDLAHLGTFGPALYLALRI